jgi:phage/plasmid primase-like uncharacterized protein
MKKLLLTVASTALVFGLAYAADLQSGPQAGQKVPGPFHPLNVNGESAGKKACLYCKHGSSPVAVVFARCADCPTTAKLLKKLDEATKANTKADLGSYAVFLSDDDKMADKLKAMVEKEGIKELTVAVDNPAGPEAYKIAKDADVTVVLYNEHKVVVNHSFKKGELKDADIDTIVKDLSKILPSSK